jgi:hypothetical protein
VSSLILPSSFPPPDPLSSYDVGVYFEANGHGTVIFSRAFVDVVNAFQPAAADPSWDNEMTQSNVRRNLAFSRLQSSLRLINQAVGDAISDMLLCMVALQVALSCLSSVLLCVHRSLAGLSRTGWRCIQISAADKLKFQRPTSR